MINLDGVVAGWLGVAAARCGGGQRAAPRRGEHNLVAGEDNLQAAGRAAAVVEVQSRARSSSSLARHVDDQMRRRTNLQPTSRAAAAVEVHS